MKRTNYSALIFFITTVVLAVMLIQTKRAERKAIYDSTTVLNKIVFVQELTLVRYNYAGVISFKDYMTIMNFQVPQQPPAMFKKPASANSRSRADVSAGNSSKIGRAHV